MKLIISIIFFAASIVITLAFTVPQYMCDKTTCTYDGIKSIRKQKISYSAALDSAKNLEARRSDLTNKYNSVSPEEHQKLESLLPNNVDNIKLVLELETLAKKHGLLVESPKLETKAETPVAEAAKNTPGQALRNDGTQSPYSSSAYGTFTLEFTVRSTYPNIKNLINDIEKNLRLIEISAISIKVPNADGTQKLNPKEKVYPKGTYDVNIKAIIYYLKN